MKFSNRKSADGSTLVEIVITVGILVTTLLPLIALLSIAMETSGKASNNTLGVRIASQLVGEIQQADWDNLNDWHDKDFYFDNQGTKLTSSGAQEDSVFTARAHLMPAGVSMTATPGVPANPWQRQVVVLVVSRPGTQGQQKLDAAVAALTGNTPLPEGVRLNRAMLVNLQKTL